MHGIPLWVEVVVYVLYHLPWFIGGAVVVGLAAWWWRTRARLVRDGDSGEGE